MRFTYPVVVTKEKDGSCKGYFPDLKGCEVSGADFQDCLDEAQLAAYNWIDLEMHEDDPQIPPSSDIDELGLKENQEARNILVIYRILEGWEE